MAFWTVVHRFDDDLVACRKESFSPNTKTFVGNWDNFPIDIFFSTVVATPFSMPLSFSIGRPVFYLALFGTISPPLASIAFLDDGYSTNFKAGSTTSSFTILNKMEIVISQLLINMMKSKYALHLILVPEYWVNMILPWKRTFRLLMQENGEM